MWRSIVSVVRWKGVTHKEAVMRYGDGYVRLIVSTYTRSSRSSDSTLGAALNRYTNSGSSKVTQSENPTRELSKRKAFKSLDLDLQLLQNLDELNLGIIRRRRSRVIVAKRLSPNNILRKEKRHKSNRQREKPFPFKYRGKLIQEAQYSDEIPSYFLGNPPEIAIVGRSNVGKSTLLNALIGFDESFVQKSSTSDKPGETRQLKFYQLGFVSDSTAAIPTPNCDSKVRPDHSGSGRKRATPLTGAQEASATVPKRPALVIVDMPGKFDK